MVLDADAKIATCQYCGTTVSVSQVPTAHEAATAGANVAAEALITRGDIARKGGDFRAAVVSYDKALELDPANSSIYWRKFLAEFDLRDEDELLAEHNFLLNNCLRGLEDVIESKTAMELASPQELEHYQEINKTLVDSLR